MERTVENCKIQELWKHLKRQQLNLWKKMEKFLEYLRWSAKCGPSTDLLKIKHLLKSNSIWNQWERKHSRHLFSMKEIKELQVFSNYSLVNTWSVTGWKNKTCLLEVFVQCERRKHILCFSWSPPKLILVWKVFDKANIHACLQIVNLSFKNVKIFMFFIADTWHNRANPVLTIFPHSNNDKTIFR